ncbi:hypothetical protein BD410DRAFT_787553 [Rickenella mellea]|uniref:Methyltransferase domain-containing protein n=1 Tax=Rickenella mellea TaxID=50990 RepID=A0A4Y7Q6E5_9AGAM|nr:hypothetical protein BD410DRAFT_787553 [Rickenella mellea]
MNCNERTLQTSLDALLKLLTSYQVSNLFNHHPNTLGAASDDFHVPNEWRSWWNWASDGMDKWTTLVKLNEYLTMSKENSSRLSSEHNSALDIPSDLVELIRHIDEVTLPRSLDPLPLFPSSQLRTCNTGMSPKKAHEVERFSSYIAQILSTLSSAHGINVRHVVDIGAGQGYLSRAIYELPDNPEISCPPLHVLALDSSPLQTSGAQRRQKHSDNRQSEGPAAGNGLANSVGACYHTNGKLKDREGGLVKYTRSLNHRTVQIGAEMSPSLENVIDDWLNELEEHASASFEDSPDHASTNRTPIHSLPHYLAQVHQDSLKDGPKWYMAAAVVVGCCYNLMEPGDFPLSPAARKSIASIYPTFELTSSHLQLAAQVPAQWFRTPATKISTSLALRKVVYRSLLEGYIARQSYEGKRLGKLNNNTYESFDTFLKAAEGKIGAFPMDQTGRITDNSEVARRLEVLHTLRCLLGPAVESLIILDRLLWLKEELGLDNEDTLTTQEYQQTSLDVRIINLFDQSKDSGRNVGIVLAPGNIL